MASDGFGWLPMAPDGSRWLPMAPDGSRVLRRRGVVLGTFQALLEAGAVLGALSEGNCRGASAAAAALTSALDACDLEVDLAEMRWAIARGHRSPMQQGLSSLRAPLRKTRMGVAYLGAGKPLAAAKWRRRLCVLTSGQARWRMGRRAASASHT